MLSIKLKRQQQANAQAKVEAKATTLAQVNMVPNIEPTYASFAAKPWDEVQATLKQDLARLRTLAGSQEKDPYKAELVKKYQPIVAKLLASHDNLENLDVIWWFYQWQVDLGLLPEIHDQLREAIDKGLETPQTWKSNGQTSYCDIVFTYSHKAHDQKLDFNRDYLIQAVSDLQEGKLATNAPLKVKMFRLVGNWHYDAGDKEQAYTLFYTVMQLDPKKGGCKIKLNKLKDELGYGDSD